MHGTNKPKLIEGKGFIRKKVDVDVKNNEPVKSTDTITLGEKEETRMNHKGGGGGGIRTIELYITSFVYIVNITPIETCLLSITKATELTDTESVHLTI